MTTGVTPFTPLSNPRLFVRSFSRTLQDNDGAGTFFRLMCSVGEGCEMIFGRKIGFTYLKNHVDCANALDATPMRTINALFGKSDPYESGFSKAKGYAFSAVNLACIPLLLQDIKAINLSQVAASIGNKVKALQFLGRISLVTVVRVLLVVGNFFGVCQAVKQMMADDFDEAENAFERRATYLELAAHVASIALYTFGLVATVSAVPIVVLGVVAYGLGVVKSVHKFAHEEQKEWQEAYNKPDKE